MAAIKNTLFVCLVMNFVIAAFNIQSAEAHSGSKGSGDSGAISVAFRSQPDGNQNTITPEGRTNLNTWEAGEYSEEVPSTTERDILTETGPIINGGTFAALPGAQGSLTRQGSGYEYNGQQGQSGRNQSQKGQKQGHKGHKQCQQQHRRRQQQQSQGHQDAETQT